MIICLTRADSFSSITSLCFPFLKKLKILYKLISHWGLSGFSINSPKSRMDWKFTFCAEITKLSRINKIPFIYSILVSGWNSVIEVCKIGDTVFKYWTYIFCEKLFPLFSKELLKKLKYEFRSFNLFSSKFSGFSSLGPLKVKVFFRSLKICCTIF